MAYGNAPDKGGVDELTKEFLAESMEGLDRMERCLTELELRPQDAELLGEIFRAVHTIKGTTGFLGFSRLEQLAHAGENLLGALRDGRLVADGELISGLLRLLDGLRVILRLIETTGAEGVRASDDDSALIALLKTLHDESGAGVTRVTEEAVASPAMAAPSGSDKTLRIEVEVLNRMMNLVGELVLTRNQILQSHTDAAGFAVLARRLDSVTADLRETVMQARLQPVGHLFGKFPRMVRDLARTCGKNVRIEFTGQETALDKSLLEAIKDPLTHAVRNAVDHGLELPAERALAGKATEGLVRLSAWHQSGFVVIEVTDDGAGISCERVIAKALERHLVSEERAAGMTDAEALQLLFLAGFSTAAAVTTISGRGVGMDVVRANVEKAGGTVEISSTVGVGTVLRLRVPLTLAIVPALVVESAGQSFCLPQSALAELVYVSAAEAGEAVERIGEAQLFRLRERMLPMVWLDRMLGLVDEDEVAESKGFYLAVLETDGCRYGLAVDELRSPEEIVVKPLSAVLREAGLFSGATVLGSGLLALILDVSATAARAGVRPVLEQMRSREAVPLARAVDASAPAFLIYTQSADGTGERMAVPLAAVERIESVALFEVEHAGGRPMLQYRGELMPLDDGGGLLRELALGGPDAIATVVICRREQGPAGRNGARDTRRVGMVVREVLDVSNGAWLAEVAEVSSVRLAMVNERLTTVHAAFNVGELWREVA